jgi:hypothetical protein
MPADGIAAALTHRRLRHVLLAALRKIYTGFWRSWKRGLAAGLGPLLSSPCPSRASGNWGAVVDPKYFRRALLTFIGVCLYPKVGMRRQRNEAEGFMSKARTLSDKGRNSLLFPDRANQFPVPQNRIPCSGRNRVFAPTHWSACVNWRRRGPKRRQRAENPANSLIFSLFSGKSPCAGQRPRWRSRFERVVGHGLARMFLLHPSHFRGAPNPGGCYRDCEFSSAGKPAMLRASARSCLLLPPPDSHEESPQGPLAPHLARYAGDGTGEPECQPS